MELGGELPGDPLDDLGVGAARVGRPVEPVAAGGARHRPGLQYDLLLGRHPSQMPSLAALAVAHDA